MQIDVYLTRLVCRSEALFSPPITPSELPLALRLPPSETPFTKFIQKNIVAVKYLATVFPAHVIERAQAIAVVMVSQKFNRKPSIGAALTDASRPLKRSQ